MTTKATNGIDLQGQRGQNFGAPSVDTDAANKIYVDNVARGLQWKKPVRLSPTANVSLSSPGGTHDGKTANVGDRLLLQNQTTASENGIYDFNGASAALTRSSDANDGTELQPGTTVTVTEGSTYGDKAFLIISDSAITIGTTAMTWGPLGGGTQAYTGSSGVAVSGSNITGVVATGGGLVVGASGFALDTSVAARKISGNVGNGSSTSIDVAHGLGTTDIGAVTLRLVSTGEMVIPDWVVKDANTITLNFPTAPATGAYRVTVIA